MLTELRCSVDAHLQVLPAASLRQALHQDPVARGGWGPAAAQHDHDNDCSECIFNGKGMWLRLTTEGCCAWMHALEAGWAKASPPAAHAHLKVSLDTPVLPRAISTRMRWPGQNCGSKARSLMQVHVRALAQLLCPTHLHLGRHGASLRPLHHVGPLQVHRTHGCQR